MKEKTDFLLEWAVWANLDSKTDLELLLLKGHLILENVIEVALERGELNNYDDLSFYRKTIAFQKIEFKDIKKKDFIFSSLKALNTLRNKLAHEWKFDVYNGELESWSKNVLDNLKGKKYTKHTFRTKIVHSFSILTINILELTDSIKN